MMEKRPSAARPPVLHRFYGRNLMKNPNNNTPNTGASRREQEMEPAGTAAAPMRKYAEHYTEHGSRCSGYFRMFPRISG
jgi:hypothetical protein